MSQFKCPRCSNYYDNWNRPQLLACGHGLCTKCSHKFTNLYKSDSPSGKYERKTFCNICNKTSETYSNIPLYEHIMANPCDPVIGHLESSIEKLKGEINTQLDAYKDLQTKKDILRKEITKLEADKITIYTKMKTEAYGDIHKDKLAEAEKIISNAKEEAHKETTKILDRRKHNIDTKKHISHIC